MLLYLLLFGSLSIHLAIDFGSQFLKSTIAHPMKNPEIAYNYDSKRLTPAYIAMRASPEFNISTTNHLTVEEGSLLTPAFGNNAIQIMELRPYLGTAFLSSYIGLNKNESSRIAKRLFVNASAARLTFLELTTLFCKLYIDCISQSKSVDSVSVVVPSTYTIPQRREIETAIRGAGFKFSKTIDDSEAVSIAYSLEKVNKFAQEPRTILFIDIGATSVKAYSVYFEFKKDANQKYGHPEFTRLTYEISTSNGGAFLTSDLVRFIISKYGLAHNPKDAEYQRLFNAAEKLKIQLTLLKSATTMVENILGDDREIILTRNELESVAVDLINTTVSIAKKACENINITDIEIIGASSRVPILLSSIQEAFNVEQLGHSMNAEECVSIGGGYFVQFQAGISKYLKVTSYSPSSLYNITMKLSNNETYQICEYNAGCLDNITINETIGQFEFFYDNANASLLKRNSFGYKVDMKPNSTLSIKFTKSGALDVIYANNCVNLSFCNNAKLQPLVPIFSASPAYHGIIKAEYQRKRLGRLRNELEHFTLRVLDELEHNESVRAFTNEIQRTQINEVAKNTKSWIWEHADSVFDERNFTQKFKEVSEAMFPVYSRIHENRTLMFNIRMMLTAIQLAKLTQYQWAINKTYLNKTEVENFNLLLKETEEWFMNVMNETRDQPLWEEPKIKSKDIEPRITKLSSELQRISKIPPPPGKISQFASSLSKKFSESWIGRSLRNLFSSRKVPPKTKGKPKVSPTPKVQPTKTKNQQDRKPKVSPTPMMKPTETNKKIEQNQEKESESTGKQKDL